MSERLPSYGGQAVLEGVMMRGANSVAIAMRAPDHAIVVHKESLGEIPARIKTAANQDSTARPRRAGE